MTIAHKDVLPLDNHGPYRWIFTNATERLALTSIDSSELYKKALQLDNELEYTLISNSPIRWKEFGTTNSIPTTIVPRLNPSPVITVTSSTSIESLYSCVNITSNSNVTLNSVPNIIGAANNSQELTLVNIGSYDITFQGEGVLSGSQVATTFTLTPASAVVKLIYVKQGLNLWYKY